MPAVTAMLEVRVAKGRLSKVRETATFAGLSIAERLGELKCGAAGVDLRRGQVVGLPEFRTAVEKVFAVHVLPGVRFPEVLGLSRGNEDVPGPSRTPRPPGRCASATMGEKEGLMVTVKARFAGQVFIPEGPVSLPAGCELEISFHVPPPGPSAQLPLAQLAEIAERFPENPDLPTDLAAQHDHYLYGTPKRP